MQKLENGKKCERLSSGRDMTSQPQIYSSRGYLNKTGPREWFVGPFLPEELWAVNGGWKGSSIFLGSASCSSKENFSPLITIYTFSSYEYTYIVLFSFLLKGRKPTVLVFWCHAFSLYHVDNTLGIHKQLPNSFWQIYNTLLYLSANKYIYIYSNVSMLLIYRDLLSH